MKLRDERDIMDRVVKELECAHLLDREIQQLIGGASTFRSGSTLPRCGRIYV